MKWFVVTMDDRGIALSVKPPLRRRWTAHIPWEIIERVCFRAEGPSVSDGLFIFTKQRCESWAIPTEAVGADRLWDELLRRNLFDANLAVEAMSATTGTFCWPPEA